MNVTKDGAVPSFAERSAIILCGGQSRRFGRDKALAVHDGRSFLETTVAVCRAAAPEVILAVGAEPRYENLGLPLVLDAVPSGGPLAGIAAGLARVSKPFFLVIAVDLPFVTAPAVETLLAALHENEYVVPRTLRGVEPLFSAGRTAPCLAASRSLLASDRPAAHRLADSVVTTFIDVTAAGNPVLWKALRNVNRPEDLEGSP